MNITSIILIIWGGRRCSDRMVVRFTTTFCNRCRSPLMWVRLLHRARCTTLCDKVLSVTCDRSGGFSGDSDIAEKMLKVALTTIKQTNQPTYSLIYFSEIVFVRFNAWLPPLLFFSSLLYTLVENWLVSVFWMLVLGRYTSRFVKKKVWFQHKCSAIDIFSILNFLSNNICVVFNWWLCVFKTVGNSMDTNCLSLLDDLLHIRMS